MLKTNIAFQKHKKLITILAVCVFVFVLMPLTALAYLGFVPGMTELMHTNKPVNLGVSYGAADFHQLEQNALFSVSNFNDTSSMPKNVENLSPGSKVVIASANSIQTTVTQSQLTAFVNMIPWSGSPLSNSQLRLSDGTVEFSGNVHASYIANLIKTNYPQAKYGQLSFLVRLASHLHNPAVYAKFSVSAVNTTGGPGRGQFYLKMLALKVNRINLSDKVASMKPVNVTVPEGDGIHTLPYSLSSLAVSNGQLNFYGTIPAEFSVGAGDPSALCNQNHGGSLVSLDTTNGRIGSAIKTCQ